MKPVDSTIKILWTKFFSRNKVECVKLSLIIVFVASVFLCGCVDMGPAISKRTFGNLEINVLAPQGVDVHFAQIFVDDVFIGNVSDEMPILFLKRGERTVRVVLSGTKTYQQSIDILGDPNHQVLNITLEKI
jgi:hypothetical protein